MLLSLVGIFLCRAISHGGWRRFGVHAESAKNHFPAKAVASWNDYSCVLLPQELVIVFAFASIQRQIAILIKPHEILLKFDG